MIVHIDCNSFFASCEIAQRGLVVDEPVVVSSSNENNGGIILALNKPAKALGLKRGQPLFKVVPRETERGEDFFIFQERKVRCFEADHHLYHQISQRIMQLVLEQEIVLDFVQYSVDEFFGMIPVDEPDDMRHYTQMVKELIETETKIPVSCGCASTYTLAKMATHFAKQYEGYKGICVLTEDKREKALGLMPIEEIWGIGRKVAPKLQQMGLRTALAFAQAEGENFAKYFNVTLYHTWQELNGKPVIRLENKDKQQSIMQSRTLPTTSHDLPFLLEQLSSYTSAAARKLREQKSRCKQITVFLNTNYHREDLAQYTNSATIRLADYEDASPILIKAACDAFRTIFREGYEIKRLGVVLEKLIDTEQMQLELFTDPQKEKLRHLQAQLDRINEKYDGEIVHTGSFSQASKKNKGITKV